MRGRVIRWALECVHEGTIGCPPTDVAGSLVQISIDQVDAVESDVSKTRASNIATYDAD
jgi:hypothetical protein